MEENKKYKLLNLWLLMQKLKARRLCRNHQPRRICSVIAIRVPMLRALVFGYETVSSIYIAPKLNKKNQ